MPDTISKEKLVNGRYYVNGNKGRGMQVGRWTEEKNCFLCIKGPKFGTYYLYEMPHEVDEYGTVFFSPIYMIY